LQAQARLLLWGRIIIIIIIINHNNTLLKEG